MRYLLEMLLVTVMPIGFGFALGGFWRKLFGRARWPALVCGILFIGVWFWSSSLLRGYADTDGRGWQLAEYWTQTARWYIYAAALLCGLGIAAGTERQSHRAARRWVYAFAVLFVVLVTSWRTFPLYVVLPPGESMRDERGFMRQTVEFTCGPVALANLLERYHGHPPFSERRIAKLAGTTYEGTTTAGLIRAAEQLGCRVESCGVLTLDDLLEHGEPAIVKIATCPGVRHATLMFGVNERMIYFADPAYGPRKMTHENFLKVWYGTTLIFEPSS
jgi:uncharacterized protein